MVQQNICGECGKPAKQCCSACKLVHYCSKECQKTNWKVHKHQCKPFEMKTHPNYGRYLVATRNIKAGELFLKEAALVIGPKQSSSPSCLGCSKKIEGQYTCTQCHYPLCSKVCQASKWHQMECSTLAKGSAKVQEYPSRYECITPMRCFLLKDKNPKQYEILKKLQSHIEEFRGTNIYRRNQKTIVDHAMNHLGCDESDAMLLHELCGILSTNSFEVNQHLRGLYNLSSYFAHSCTPNIKHAFDEDLNILWRTSRPVSKGETLYNIYTQILWNTLQRQIHLKASKFFVCSCERCSDPTELDTDMSTLLCYDCGGRILSEDPTIMESKWTCIACAHSIAFKQISWGDQSLYKEIKDIGKRCPKELESFLQRYSKALHPKHRFFVEAKYALIRYYGNYAACPYKDMNREQLENKVKWCKELLEIANVIDSGKSLFRGNILMELQAGIVGLSKYMYSNDLITEADASTNMTEAVTYLQEASEILRHEPHLANGGLDDRLSWLSKELDL